MQMLIKEKKKGAEVSKELKKLHENLQEKAEIIAKKNDKIEMLNERIEELEAGGSRLNVIHESLCQKCGNSLEESVLLTIPDSDEVARLNEELQKMYQIVNI